MTLLDKLNRLYCSLFIILLQETELDIHLKNIRDSVSLPSTSGIEVRKRKAPTPKAGIKRAKKEEGKAQALKMFTDIKIEDLDIESLTVDVRNACSIQIIIVTLFIALIVAPACRHYESLKIVLQNNCN